MWVSVIVCEYFCFLLIFLFWCLKWQPLHLTVLYSVEYSILCECLSLFVRHSNYLCHVDDILILYRGNKRQCEQLLMHINKIHKNITFTAEYEHNNTINFLDLSITKLEHRHKFSIYRKPTTSDTLIHNTSNHPCLLYTSSCTLYPLFI